VVIVVLDSWKENVVLNNPFIGIWFRGMERTRGSAVGGERVKWIILVFGQPDG